MPVKSQIKLLAGVAALLSLCAAGAGCQSSSCRNCQTNSCADCAPGSVMLPAGMVGTSGNILSKANPLFIGRSTQEPALAQAAPCDHCQAAVMLRPVPLPGESGAWTPVQRVSNESTAGSGSGISQAVTMERPSAGGMLPPPPSGGGEILLPPMSISTEGLKNDNGRQLAAAPPPDSTTLPTPRKDNNTSKENSKETSTSKTSSGYPDLPPVMITHPVEAPREFAKRALSAYIIEPPDVLAIEGIGDIGDPKLPITGPHLVRPDGTIGLGTYGAVFVAGMTIEQAKEQIIALIRQRQTNLSLQNAREGLKVDVAAYNSKFYYVITDGGGFGEQVVRVPCTGNETVLDAIAQIQGLPAVASKKRIWIARATPAEHEHPYILPVDWCGVTQRGYAATNYQIYPGDRIYVNSNKFIRADSYLAKVLAPIERLLGVTLLGSSVVNSIKSGTSTGAGSGVVR